MHAPVMPEAQRTYIKKGAQGPRENHPEVGLPLSSLWQVVIWQVVREPSHQSLCSLVLSVFPSAGGSISAAAMR